jgi:hypothetical protein
MPELAAHRGKTVDDLIHESVERYLDRSTFNNIADIINALDRMGIDHGVVAPHKSLLIPLMQRRHRIAHRVDRNQQPAGPGIHKSAPITTATVQKWKGAVQGFGEAILAELVKKP